VIVLAVRWYLRFALSYRDVEEVLAERGVEVDHVTVYRWVVRFTPLLAEAARPCRHQVGDRWRVEETSVKWHPVEVVTDRALTYPLVLAELLPAVWHQADRYANNGVEADHGRLKARLRPMRGLKQDRSARVVDRWACLRAEPPPQSRRAGGRGARDPSAGGRVWRTRRGDLIPSGGRGFSARWTSHMQQRRRGTRAVALKPAPPLLASAAPAPSRPATMIRHRCSRTGSGLAAVRGQTAPRR
jgi:hypothetical protein